MIPIKQLFKKINGVIQPFYPITHEQAVFDGGGRKLSEKLATYEENLSDAFSEEKTYAVGDYVIYQNRLYKFTSTKEVGAFDGTKVIPCSVMEEMNERIPQNNKGDIRNWLKQLPDIFIDRESYVDDADTLKVTGCYRTGSSSKNVPSTNGFLICFGCGWGVTMQLCSSYAGTPLYYRTAWYSSGFYPWKTISIS